MTAAAVGNDGRIQIFRPLILLGDELFNGDENDVLGVNGAFFFNFSGGADVNEDQIGIFDQFCVKRFGRDNTPAFRNCGEHGMSIFSTMSGSGSAASRISASGGKPSTVG